MVTAVVYLTFLFKPLPFTLFTMFDAKSAKNAKKKKMKKKEKQVGRNHLLFLLCQSFKDTKKRDNQMQKKTQTEHAKNIRIQIGVAITQTRER